MVAHDTIGKHPHPAEILILSHHADKNTLFLPPQHELAINDPGYTVIEAEMVFSRGRKET